jgi:hypothetical protein
LLPSAEDAAQTQSLAGASVGFHVLPEFVETKMGPVGNSSPTTTIVAPAAETATAVHACGSIEAWFQSPPEFVEM